MEASRQASISFIEALIKQKQPQNSNTHFSNSTPTSPEPSSFDLPQFSQQKPQPQSETTQEDDGEVEKYKVEARNQLLQLLKPEGPSD